MSNERWTCILISTRGGARDECRQNVDRKWREIGRYGRERYDAESLHRAGRRERIGNVIEPTLPAYDYEGWRSWKRERDETRVRGRPSRVGNACRMKEG